MLKKKILIVDDEKDLADMLKMGLEKTGAYEVLTENKGMNVPAVILRFKPDLVFLDVMMPDIDGGEVASKVVSDESIKDTPIVFLTAAVTKEEVSSQKNAIGGYPFVAKPVTVEELMGYIKQYAR